MTTNFLSDVQLESMAGRCLGHDESICGAVAGPSGAGGAHPQECACHNTSMQEDLI